MRDDPFAFQVDRLTHRHRDRHPPAVVAEVTLQRWLTLRGRYADPFDADLFDRIDAALIRMPASRDDGDQAGDDGSTRAASTPPIRLPRRPGRTADSRPVSWSA